MDNGYATGVLFLDLKKAFDTVNHDILIKKLKHYGVDNRELLWFKSYLANRSQTVNVNSTLSDFQPINIGIPQGSILGPLLFIIFVNCLPCAVDECKTVMYADDTSLMYKAKNASDLQNQLESCLSKVADWFKANKLRSTGGPCSHKQHGSPVYSKPKGSLRIATTHCFRKQHAA